MTVICKKITGDCTEGKKTLPPEMDLNLVKKQSSRKKKRKTL